jgi:glycosyltransferase involved in cell wall biosynthesis
MLAQITPIILTYNEAPNITRTIAPLVWAEQIIVIDSYSTDATLEILASYPNVKVLQRTLGTHARQWNFGVEQVQTEWCLTLDADYRVSEELIAELQRLQPPVGLDGYFVTLRYCVFGQPLRSSILPPRQVLFRKNHAYYIDDGHTQLLRVQGRSGQLGGAIDHDDRKSLGRWVWAQKRYTALEVEKLATTPGHELSLGDRIRKTKILAPLAILIYCLILKGGIFDGWRGWYYAVQRVIAELLLVLGLIEYQAKHRSQQEYVEPAGVLLRN